MNIFSKNILIVLIFLGITFFIILGNRYYKNESEQIRLEFQQDVQDKVLSIDRETSLNYELLYSIKGLFDSSDSVNSSEFSTLATSILNRHNDIQALEWIPKVEHKDRVYYENEQKKIYSDFEFTEKDSQGFMQKREVNDYYYPVYYVEPLQGNELAWGYDLASSSKRLEALNKSVDQNRLISTSSIELIQLESKEKGFLTILPVYKKHSATLKQRRENIVGFVVAVFRIKSLINTALNSTSANGIDLELIDITEQKHELLYKKSSLNENFESKSDFRYEQVLSNIDGRKWLIVANPTNGYVAQRRTILPWLIVIFGTVFIILNTLYIYLMMQRNTFIERKVQLRTEELNKLNVRLESISRTDALTQISNRRYFNEYIEIEYNRATRDKNQLSIIMIDIDYFKQFNDSYGHLEGDRCLKEVAYSLRESLNRSTDLVARYGGEEFVMILSNTNDALSLAQKCRRNIEMLSIPHEFSAVSNFVTISLGVATIVPEQCSSISTLVDMADKALYNAKKDGRNRVCVYHDELENISS